MNTYGHRAPQYPYAKDGIPHYNPDSYSLNPMSHPNAPLGANPQFPHTKYGHRHSRHDSLKHNYMKDVPPTHLEYNHAGWPNAGSDAPPHFPVNPPPAPSHVSYSDMKLENYSNPHSFNKPEQPQSQNGWEDNLLNQFPNVRLAIFVENCNYSCELMESDLKELFSYYSGINSISISPEYPAAELILNDTSACSSAVTDLNGFVLNGIGTLRCVLMRAGQTLTSLLSNANIFPFYKVPPPNPMENTRYSYNPVDSHPPPKNSNFVMPDHYDHGHNKNNRHISLNGVDHVPGITNKPNVKRMSRFELMQLFSYEPDFDVTNAILGPNNANIEYIMKNSNNKVDISLKGKPLNSAPVSDRLHLSITSNEFYAYNKAIYMVEDLLSSVCEKYVEYIRGCGHALSGLIGFRRHEYEEDSDGVLDYKGFVDKPKSWLDQHHRRNNFKHGYRNNFSKKVNDRSRTISNSRHNSSRIVPNHRNRGMRK